MAVEARAVVAAESFPFVLEVDSFFFWRLFPIVVPPGLVRRAIERRWDEGDFLSWRFAKICPQFIR